jgi:CheY-like chemotaxis protein
LLNLVGNAIKFTTEGQITVRSRLLNQNKDTVTIEFSVADSGIGIPENRQHTIFDNFEQAASGTTRLYGGTGLGLAIVKQLLEAQGGIIRVKSEVGKGSVFSFELTFGKTNETTKIEKEEDIGSDLQTEMKGVKVLVVEDIALNQLLVKTWLEEIGVIIDEAENGREAIEKVKNNTYDIILMDLQMPEMNGFEATVHIRTNLNSKVPIIALTADVTTVDVEKCKAIGMNDYISKPIDEKILYSKIRKFLKGSDVNLAPDSSRRIKTLPSSGEIINLNYLKRLAKNNAETISEVIRLYLRETPKLIHAMRKAFDQKDWDSLRAASHSLLPSFRTMGMDTELETGMRKMEKYATHLRDRTKEGEQEQKILTELEEQISKTERMCELAYAELRKEQLAIG